MARAKSFSSTPTSARAGSPPAAPSDDERQRMIAEAAYYRAAARGFHGGDPVDDWLAAEREIERLLPSPRQQKQELAAYQKVRDGVQKILAGAREGLSADNIREALDTTRAQLHQLGEFTADTIEKMIVTTEREMLGAAQRMGARLENFSEKSAGLFYVWRDRSNQFLTRAAGAVKDWAEQTGARIGARGYRTGDMAAAGVLECAGCGERITLATPAHVPLCPKCRKTDFRRVE